MSLPDLYRATATVIVERQQVPEAYVKASVTAELETRIERIRQELMSRARLSDLILRFDLYPNLRKKAPLDAVVDRMRRDIPQLTPQIADQPFGRITTISFA